MMTKKDFNVFAHHLGVVKAHEDETIISSRHLMMSAILCAMQEINPRFDRERFLTAVENYAEKERKVVRQRNAQIESNPQLGAW